MDFALSEEQQELAGLAARILEDRMELQHLKERDRSDDWYDLDTWREFAKANLLGIALPETVGGLGFGFVDLCMVLREVGRQVAPLPMIPTLVSAALPIARFGTDAQHAVLSKVVAGDLLLTAALVEYGSEPEQPATTATRDGDGWRLDGLKGSVPGAGRRRAGARSRARRRRRRSVRSLVGYGQMASKFFGNRNVMLGLIVAILAMVGLVGVIGLLDRAQPGGISLRTFIAFALATGIILAVMFVVWLRKSQSGAVLGAPDAETTFAILGMVAAFSVFILLIGGFVFVNFLQKRALERQQEAEQDVVQQFIDIPNEQPTPDVGTAGLNKGKGGGSKPKQEKPGGGGGGGREDQKPASFGKTPQASLTVPQVVAPDPHPPTIKNPVLPMAATVVADPMLVPPDARNLNYGDPKSKSTDISSGPGTGNGIGTGKGGGIGPGEGGGIGPGRGGNIGGGDRNDGGGGPGGGGGGTDYNKVFSGKDVSSKARVLSKPEPQYTEEARKNQVTGTVVLRAVFTSGGQVTGIRAVSGLPYGLTERAIAAARLIKFVPATKDGRPVSMYIQLEYNFNLY